MHRLHQTSILILATILLSTSSLSGCRSPAASRAAKEKVEYVNEVSEMIFQRCSLSELELESARANLPIKQASRTICGNGILEESQNNHISNAVYDELNKANNDDSLTGLEKVVVLKKVAFEAATKEAQKLDINLSKAQLQIIAQEATYTFLRLASSLQQQASSPSLPEQIGNSIQKHIFRPKNPNPPPIRVRVGH